MSGAEPATNGQRALFTFLGFSLLAPFFSGFAVLAALILAPPLQLAPLLPATWANPGEAALLTFVWAAIPAGLAGVPLAVMVWRAGTFTWITAAAAGGLAFMSAAILRPFPAQLSLTLATAFAAFVAIAVRAALVSGRIIRQ